MLDGEISKGWGCRVDFVLVFGDFRVTYVSYFPGAVWYKWWPIVDVDETQVSADNLVMTKLSS